MTSSPEPSVVNDEPPPLLTESHPCQSPTVSELIVVLDKLVDLELVAVHLRGMSHEEIMKIVESHQNNVDKQKFYAFSKWLSMCPDPSWDDVVTALEKGNELALAEKVKKYRKEKAKKKDIPIKTEETKYKITFPEDEEEEIIDELNALYGSFTVLLLEVQEKIKETIRNKEMTLSEIARKIWVANLKQFKKITECTTVDELINNITNKCSFLDGSILHRIVKFGLPDCNDLISRTEQHMKRARKFRKKASIRHLKDQVNEKVLGHYQAPLVAKLNDVWDRTNIDHVTMLIEYLADDKDINPRLVQVVSSSVEVTLLISEDDKACFNITTEHKKQFLYLIGMFYLKVGENPPIFQQDENMNYTFEYGLLEAAKIGHVQAIKFILSIGIDVDYQNNEGKTALLLASEHGHSEAVKLILSAGASVDIQDNIGQTAVMVAKIVDIYQTLVQANANTNIVTHRESTPLMMSCLHGNHDVANYLLFTLKHNITTRPDGLTLLMAASQGGNNKIVEYLLNNGDDPNIQDNDGRTAIQLSCLKGQYTVTESLLKHNADPSIPDNNGWTPLMNASQEGHHKMVDLLLSNGAEPNIQDNDGDTAIQLSCLNGHYTVTEILLKNNADPSIPDNNGWTPLMNAIQEGHHKILDLLLSNGAEPNIQDNDGDTAIQLSCLNGQYTVTESLLKHNADPSIPDNNGWTPLVSASHEGHHKIVDLLLQKQVDPNTPNNKNGLTALMLASGNGHNETVELLLSSGAEPNIQDNDGKTAIQLSCFNGHYTVTESLLKHNADPTLCNNRGNTPIMLAIYNKHYNIVELLVDNGVTHDEDTTMKPMVTPISSTGYHKKLNIIKYNSQHQVKQDKYHKTEHNRLLRTY